MARCFKKKPARRGSLLVLAALLLIALLAMVACAIDLGYTVLVRTQLQATADAAALAAVADLPNAGNVRATARQYATLNHASTGTVLSDSNIVLGTWDSAARVFTPSDTVSNAVKVTVTRTHDTENAVKLLFAPAIGVTEANVTATSIAVARPRDIAFVLDLSGSMNNDTEIWATAAIDSANAGAGFPTIGTDLMSAVFQDFGYGSYPGTTQYVGNGNVAENNQAFYELTRNGGYLAGAAIAPAYQILTNDSAATRKQKGYRWLIDNQLASVMPNALPAPDSTLNYAYWEVYLDYIIQPYTLTSAQRANYANYNGSVPANQGTYNISDGGNPDTSAWPSLTSTAYSVFYNRLGYQTYVQFMMDFGRNRNVVGSTKVPLSAASGDCPFNQDTDPNSGGFGFLFPPREQPTHACRVAIMAAIDNIAARNNGLAEAIKDHVAIITFDTASDVIVKYPLNVASCDYNAAKSACRTLQAVADDTASTASENGLILAKNHLDPALNTTGARVGADKVVVFLTDGRPNIKQSSNTTVDNFVSNYNATHNPDGEWFGSGTSSYREKNAAMMQVEIMRARGWRVYSVGIGLGADRALMDRMARMAGTGIDDPNNPTGPKISPYAEGNPASYQQRLSSIFNDIILQGNGQLVK